MSDIQTFSGESESERASEQTSVTYPYRPCDHNFFKEK